MKNSDFTGLTYNYNIEIHLCKFCFVGRVLEGRNAVSNSKGA